MSLEQITNSSLFAKAVESIKSNLCDKNSTEFSDILKNNFSTIDPNRDNALSVSEINSSLKELGLNNISELVSKLDLNGDNMLSVSELESRSGLAKTLKGAVTELIDNKASGEVLTNAVSKLVKNYKLNDTAASIVNNIVEKLV